MSLYSIVESIHVIVAVGGLGQLAVIAYVARKPEEGSLPLLKRLVTDVSGSLVVMLLTGIWLLWLENGIYAHTGWFGLSMLLFLALGALTGITRGTLKKIEASGVPIASSPLLGKLRALTLWADILLVLIVFLMEGKPF
ncbi:MAG TPA: hypothetical protein VFH95_12000 [Candidatus Kapabacteria bacterium]|nr:hypothetical protein [Candidatus Kapabacteria bacterium]